MWSKYITLRCACTVSQEDYLQWSVCRENWLGHWLLMWVKSIILSVDKKTPKKKTIRQKWNKEKNEVQLTFMSSSRPCGSSMPSGAHFLFSGRDSSFSTRAFSPLSSNSVRWVHLLGGSGTGDPVGVLGRSTGLAGVSSESFVWACLGGRACRSSCSCVSQESSSMSSLESEEKLSVLSFLSASEEQQGKQK